MKAFTDRVPSRVILEGVAPEIDCGRFPIKRTVGEEVVVEADIHTDGHEVLAAALRYRPAEANEWTEVAMTPRGNDRWSGRFLVTRQGYYEYTLQGWIDRFAKWRHDLGKKADAGQDVGGDP